MKNGNNSDLCNDGEQNGTGDLVVIVVLDLAMNVTAAVLSSIVVVILYVLQRKEQEKY